MATYRLATNKLSEVSGSFATIGTYDDAVYVEGEDLKSPFEPAMIPQVLQERVSLELSKAKANKLEALNASYEDFVSTLAGAPQTEILTWSQQEAEALAYQKSKQQTHAPMLSALSQTRGVPLPALCAKVIAKAEAYRHFIAYAIGQRQALEDSIERAQTLGAVESLYIHFALPTQAEAEADTDSQEIVANTEGQG